MLGFEPELPLGTFDPLKFPSMEMPSPHLDKHGFPPSFLCVDSLVITFLINSWWECSLAFLILSPWSCITKDWSGTKRDLVTCEAGKKISKQKP